MWRLVLVLVMAVGLAGAAPPERLEGPEREELLELRAVAAEARVQHLAALRQVEQLASAADEAIKRLEEFAKAKAGESGCALLPDGGWDCPPEKDKTVDQ